MGHRVVKRVPLDFDWPQKERWKGYLCDIELPECPDCKGDGYSREARAIADTFYAHNIASSWDRREQDHAQALAWNDKLGQAEVDNLVAEGRLRECLTVPESERCGKPCVYEKYPQNNGPCGRREGHEGTCSVGTHEWVTVPRTAAEVNAQQNTTLNSHDAINRWILISFRCKVLGIPEKCPRCEGHGDIGTPELRDAVENFEPTEPPTGDGWQLWETTTEGSPASPVFDSAEKLAAWCEHGATAFADIRWTAAEWLASFQSESTSADTLLVMQDGERIQP